MKSNIYKMLENFFDDTIIAIAKKMDYSEENILILENNEEKLKEEYSETYNNLKSCRHNRDGRSEMEYAQDLICSWIFEDYLILNLKLNGINLESNGTDFERKILNSSSVSSQSDLLIKSHNKNIYIELVNDYKGYWKKYGKVDLRDDKYLHIKELCTKDSESLLLGIDFSNKKYFLFNLADNNGVTYIPFHFPFKKPAYSIDLKSAEYNEFSFENICDSIKKYIESNI